VSQGIPWSSHRVRLRDAVVEGYLVNDSPLRVGAGREPPLGSTVDLAVLRVAIGGRKVPYIPGSSLKGVFRSTAMQLALAKGLHVCSGLSGYTCMDQEFTEHGGITLMGYVQDRLRVGDVMEAIRAFHEKACLLCKMFGSPSFTGHVVFSDAYPLDERGEIVEVPIGVRTGIAIDRRTGAVHAGALYQVEYVEPGARFRFTIAATNLPNYALGLLLKALRLLHEGWVRVGGFKTRGFGRVHVEDLRMSIWGPTVEQGKLAAVDDKDLEVDLGGIMRVEEHKVVAEGDVAWQVVGKLEEVWEQCSARLKS